MNFESNAFHQTRVQLIHVLNAAFQLNVAEEELQLQLTRKEFEGDVTLVIFPLAKKVGKNPEAFGAEIGNALQNQRT